MTVKVKHILIALLTIITTIIMYRFSNNPINEFITRKKYENQILNCLNFDSFDNMSDETLDRYNYFKNYYNEPNIDITPLVESYIKQIETNERNKYNSGGLAVGLSSNIERTIEGGDYTNVSYLYYGKNRKLSIEELEKILIHKSNDKYSDWCIPKDSPKIIDLPYNYYLEYEPSDFKLIDNVKKVTKCTFLNKLEIDTCNGRNDIIVEYIDKNDSIKKANKTAVLSKEDSGKITISISGLYYSELHSAKVELHNHYSDEIAGEWQRIHEMDFDDVYWDWEREDCKVIVDKFR